MKKISLALIIAALFGAESAFAQAYYTIPAPAYGSGCVSISRDLSVGSRGTDVLELQKYIVSRAYPGAGSWMLTSYYGPATRAGVINLQMDLRVPQTGVLDATTRAALSQMTCGYSTQYQNTYPYTQSYQYPYAQNQYQWPYNTYNNITQPWYNYNSYTYGNNYNDNCNALYGASTCQCIPGQSGWYSVNGRSYYNYCGTNSTGALSISFLSPNSGNVGTSVTVYGSGFTTTGNTVRFGNGILTGLNSGDGRSISFVIPATLSGYGYAQVTPGIYQVSVTNASGATSNAVPFTVTGYGGGSTNAPWISNVSGPNTLQVYTAGTWMVSINNPSGAQYSSISVNWGDAVYGAYQSAAQQIYGSQQTATFTHTYSQPGTYTITFTVSNGYGSNTSTQTVQVRS